MKSQLTPTMALADSGSGASDGSDLSSLIISVGQDAQGLRCTLRNCYDEPGSPSEVDEACPVQAQATIPAGQFGQGKVPVDFDLAESGATERVKSECWNVLATPVLEAGVSPSELANYQETVGFSSDCRDLNGTVGEICQLLEAAANFPHLKDPSSSSMPPTEATESETPSPNLAHTTLSTASGGTHSQPHESQPGGMEAVQQFWKSLIMDPFANNATSSWKIRGNELYNMGIGEISNSSFPVHRAHATIIHQQQRQAGIQAQTWQIQKYFAIGMAIATMLTVVGTLIILSKACYDSYRGCRGWTQQQIQKSNQKGHEKREQRRLKRAQKAFQDMQDCGIILSSPCVGIPRRPTKGMDTTDCHVGGPEVENNSSALDLTRRINLSDAPVQLRVRADLHDNTCNGWCQGERKPDKTTPLPPVISKIARPEVLVESGPVTSMAWLPSATLTELPPTHTRPDTGNPQGDPERGPDAVKDIPVYLMEPHEKKAVTRQPQGPAWPQF